MSENKPNIPGPCSHYSTKHKLRDAIQENLLGNYMPIKENNNKDKISKELANDLILNENILKAIYLSEWEFEWHTMETCAHHIYLQVQGLNETIRNDPDSDSNLAKYIIEDDKISTTFIFMKKHICGFYKQCNLTSFILNEIRKNQFSDFYVNRTSIWHFVKRISKLLDSDNDISNQKIINQGKILDYISKDLNTNSIPRNFIATICESSDFVNSMYALINIYKSNFKIIGD